MDSFNFLVNSLTVEKHMKDVTVVSLRHTKSLFKILV